MATVKDIIRDSLENLNDDIKKLNDIMLRVSEKVSGMEQHLKDLNGRVIDHQIKLQKIDRDVIENKISLAKIASIGSIGGTVASLFIYTIGKLLGL